MIRSFRHRGIEKFFRKGSKAGISPDHADRLRLLLAALNAAQSPLDMNAPGWNLHEHSKSAPGLWAVTVRANWRLTFRFDGQDAEDVDYLDYH